MARVPLAGFVVLSAVPWLLAPVSPVIDGEDKARQVFRTPAQDGMDVAGPRERHLRPELRAPLQRAADSAHIDFSGATIHGARLAPIILPVTSTEPDHAHDLVSLRLRWHPEMVRSTASVATGLPR